MDNSAWWLESRHRTFSARSTDCSTDFNLMPAAMEGDKHDYLDQSSPRETGGSVKEDGIEHTNTGTSSATREGADVDKNRMDDYQGLADFMSEAPTMSIFRQFTSLNVQDILFRQAELAYLEGMSRVRRNQCLCILLFASSQSTPSQTMRDRGTLTLEYRSAPRDP